MVDVWAEILRRLPASRLVLKYRGWRTRRARRFASCSPRRDRARQARSARPIAAPGILADYHRIDLALDPFPYSGGLTTCEALWMGVPVVTCPGETFASRHSLSHLSNVGLTETIAHDFDEYVELAVSLAGDLPRWPRRAACVKDGRLAALRWEALCGKLDGQIARRLARMVCLGRQYILPTFSPPACNPARSE